MGLDMYLYRKTYVKNWDHMKPEELTQVTVTRDNEPLSGLHYDKIAYIVEQVAYWRKANAIHLWFVNTCQAGIDNCQEAYVSTDSLKALVSTCQEVIKNPSKGPELLPTTEGFFFGGTQYDEYYIDDLQNTIDQLTPFIKEGGDFYYHASW